MQHRTNSIIIQEASSHPKLEATSDLKQEDTGYLEVKLRR